METVKPKKLVTQQKFETQLEKQKYEENKQAELDLHKNNVVTIKFLMGNKENIDKLHELQMKYPKNLEDPKFEYETKEEFTELFKTQLANQYHKDTFLRNKQIEELIDQNKRIVEKYPDKF